MVAKLCYKITFYCEFFKSRYEYICIIKQNTSLKCTFVISLSIRFQNLISSTRVTKLQFAKI